MAAVGAVAACGGSAPAATPPTTGSAPTTEPETTVGPSAPVGNGAAGTKLGPAAAVPVGGGVVYQ
ncbi:MAG: hypothetical protein QOI16_3652, partial [Pseudonocardiales bacterium]|nr:hypothetical protein [Pseudonocardiales bacterium]